MTDDADGVHPADPTGLALADVSRAVVALHKRHYGKGPTKARSTLARNVLTVILEGGYTTAEETLMEHGAIREVVSSRLAMQGALEDDFRAAVETILRRAVRSFMSANDPTNNMQAEIFVLEPSAADELADGGAFDARGAAHE